MYISKLILDPFSRSSAKITSDIYYAHRKIYSGFSEHALKEARILYRIEVHKDCYFVLVQSAAQPAWEKLGSEDSFFISAAVKEFSPNLNPDAHYFFTLRANTVVCRNGKRHGIVREESQKKWLIDRQAKYGFLVNNVIVSDEGYVNGVKGGKELLLKSVRYDGVLGITDPKLMHQALQLGIGPGKGFGFGLLSLARIQTDVPEKPD
jgi:CRISPR system Cascade subunit CasE